MLPHIPPSNSQIPAQCQRIQPSTDHLESESHSVVSYSVLPHGLYSSWNSPGQNTRMGSCSLLQGIFPTQESNPGPPALQADSLPAEPQGKPNTTWKQHQIPQVEGPVLEDFSPCPTSNASASPGCYLCSCLNGYRLEVSMNFSPGFRH